MYYSSTNSRHKVFRKDISIGSRENFQYNIVIWLFIASFLSLAKTEYAKIVKVICEPSGDMFIAWQKTST